MQQFNRTGNDLRPLSNIRNLQNLPSNSTYGKLIKSCVQAPSGWLYVGLDFHSLEDYISALTTRDKNKMRVYLEGFDGHCLRAYSYNPEGMPDITAELNEVRQSGKTFEVVLDDGTIKYFNEHNPHIQEFLNAHPDTRI